MKGLGINKDIFWLDITMDKVETVHVSNRLADLIENVGDLIVTEIPPILGVNFFVESDKITRKILKD